MCQRLRFERGSSFTVTQTEQQNICTHSLTHHQMLFAVVDVRSKELKTSINVPHADSLPDPSPELSLLLADIG